jgi:site-specific DNA-cytosine methylase
MKHHGNVTKINGAEVEPVDIITFGSPCQDLSVAGKRAGIQDGGGNGIALPCAEYVMRGIKKKEVNNA